jgi:uncharacterized protein YndB with AHSA1/START domain
LDTLSEEANMQLDQIPVVKAEMLIRRPVADVFEAFVDPEITTRFWFTQGSGRLQPGAHVQWRWEMYDASAEVHVQAIEPDRRILIEWGDTQSGFTTVEWLFFPQADDTTFVRVTNAGFDGSADEVVAQALDSMGGCTNLLAAAKAWLEHGIMLNLVADHFPTGLDVSWDGLPEVVPT